MKNKIKKPITRRFFIYIIVLIILSNILLFLSISVIVRNIMEKQVTESSINLLQRNLENVNEYLAGIDNVANSLIYNQDLIELVKRKENTLADVNLMSSIFSIFYQSRNDLKLIIYKESEPDKAYSIYSGSGLTETGDFHNSEWYRKISGSEQNRIMVSNQISAYTERENEEYVHVMIYKIKDRFTDSNLNHTGIYLYSKGKIMIHLTFDYKTDEKCTTPGQYLKYHRTFQGLSTRELAEKVGIVPATLVLYENDRHPIKYSTAVALANVLGIDRNRLLDEYTAFVDYPYFSLLKKVRQDLSLTQIQMAELIGIGQTSYSGWEREIRVPRRKEYDKILAALKKLRVNVDTYLCQSASI